MEGLGRFVDLGHLDCHADEGVAYESYLLSIDKLFSHTDPLVQNIQHIHKGEMKIGAPL